MGRGAKFSFITLALISLLLCSSGGCGGGGGGGTVGGGSGGGTGGGQGTIAQIFPGIAVENAQAINDSGAILGNRPVSKAVYQSPSGVVSYLACPSGSTQNIAYSLNTDGEIAGTCVILDQNSSVPAIWNALNLTVLQSAPVSQYPFTMAYCVNDAGQIVGAETSTSATHGLYWASSTSAPVTIGPTGFTAYGINDSGAIVGYAASSDTSWSYYLLASSTAMPTVLGTVMEPKNSSPEGIFINAGGQIAYNGGSSSEPEVYLVSAGGQQKAVTPGLAFSINSQGDVAGALVDTQATIEQIGAFVYTAQNGVENLKNYLPSNSGWTLTSAHSINDSGVVVGEGNLNGVSEFYKMQLPKGAY